MITFPTLYPSLSDLIAGVGSYTLSDVVSMNCIEERNGAFDVEFEYLYAGLNADQIAVEAIVMAIPQKNGTPEPFRIYEVSTPINGVVTVKAHHLSYDLDGIVLQPFIKYSFATVISEVNSQLSAGGFAFRLVGNGITSSEQFSITYPQTAASVLGQGLHSLVNVYGAELSYEWDAANGYEKIILNASRGVASSATVSYGVNLLSLESNVNAENVYSAIYPYAKFTTNNVTTLITLPEETILTGATTSRDRTLLVDLSSMFEDIPTENELRQAANDYIAQTDWNALESCSFDFVPLQDTTEYENNIGDQSLSLCDTVQVSADIIGVSRTAQVVKTEFNQLTNKYNKMTVGIIEQTIADTIAGLQSGDASSLTAHYQTEAEAAVVGAVTDNTPSAFSIPNNAWTELASITLDAGTYIIVGYCNYTSNATGHRRIVCSTTSGANTQFVRGALSSGNALNGMASDENFTVIATLSATTTLYLNGYQNSGGSLSVNPRLTAMRIK